MNESGIVIISLYMTPFGGPFEFKYLVPASVVRCPGDWINYPDEAAAEFWDGEDQHSSGRRGTLRPSPWRTSSSGRGSSCALNHVVGAVLGGGGNARAGRVGGVQHAARALQQDVQGT